ncbi:MAG: DNA recombination protein RmuC, partial [Gammaproteobacteria bacterium]|nr:DNA recombination protein RmuC [Gammaproteobacteria bacterium]
MNSENLIDLLMLGLLLAAVVLLWQMRAQQVRMEMRNDEQNRQFQNLESILRETDKSQLTNLAEMQRRFEQRFGEMQNSIEKRLGEMSQSSIEKMADSNKQMQELLHQRLKEISGQVEKRLDKGFEKTTETFTNVVSRLAKIDEAQKKITELSSNVVSLQEVLSDKRSRGAFGEVQMAALVRNMMPENSFSLQHNLSNGTRVDCM